MDLLIDIGNTRFKWAMLAKGSLREADALEHGAEAGVINNMLERIISPPTAVMAANVAGERFAELVAAAVRERWGLPVQFAITQPRAGPVSNGYDDYRQLGVDRWLAIIAAVDRFAGPVCIVDAGTAVTIDAVATGGAHLGGYIVPGLDLMRQSLGEETGDLHRFTGDQSVQLPPGIPLPGCGTDEAISGGAIAAVCSLIERCIVALGTAGDVPTLVVTGGDAQRLIRHLDVVAHLRPLLVLEGLMLYEFDKSPG